MSVERVKADSPWLNRWGWVIFPLVFSMLPFGPAWREGNMAGTGPDVVSSVWAMWWFQQEWSSGAWGAQSTLFNYPWGGQGAILSPMSAVLWSVLNTMFGPAQATTLCDWFLLMLTMVSTMFLGRALGFHKLAMGGMALMYVVPRYFVFTLGETGVVGVAALPLIMGLTAFIYAQRTNSIKMWLIFVCMIGLQGIENPYLAPVLPGFLLVQMIMHRRLDWWKWLALGTLGMLAVVVLFRGASGDYESVRPSGYTQLFGFYFPAIERPWARTDWWSLLNPSRVLWPSGSMDSIHIQGREYIGFSGIVIVFLALREKASWLWVVMAFTGLILVTGSVWGDSPSVFGLLNSVADVLVRPFTQPSRYFVLYMIGASIAVGYGIHQVGKWGMLCWVMLLMDAVFFGGLSLRLPTTILPDSPCVLASEIDGPTLVWPWDGADDQWFESSLQSRLFQMVHEQPGATIATGSWALEGTVFPGKRLRDIGWRRAMDNRGELDVQQLYDWGYRFAIVDETAGRVLSRKARDDIFGVDNRILDCPTIDVYRLKPR